MTSSRVVERDSCKNLDVDKGVKNGWRWDWLEKSVDGHRVGEFTRKLEEKGIARCLACNKDINYSAAGWKCLERHLRKKVHLDNRKLRISNYSLSGRYFLYCISCLICLLA